MDYRQFKKDSKRFEDILKNTIKCKCGCSVVFSKKTDRIICRWCGNYIYRTPKLEFEYKIKEKIIKMKKVEYGNIK